MTIASLFPDTPLKQVVFATALLAGSYVAAALVNASPIVQPPLPNRSPREVILVVPPAGTPEASPSRISLDDPTRAL